MKKTRVYMGVPSTGDRSDAQVFRLRSIEKRYADKVELVYPTQLVHRVSHDFARNMIVRDFLISDCDILWFLDSDVVPHPDVLDILDNITEWEAAGAPYPLFISQKGWDGPQVVLAVYRKTEKGFYPCEVPNSGSGFVDGIATGCLFLKKDVFKSIQEPYFEHKYDSVTRELTEGEDLGFCRKLSELGIKFHINFAHICKHYKRVDLLDVNNYAINYANQHKLFYERELNNFAARLTIANLERKQKLSEPNRTSSGLVLTQPHVLSKR